MQILLSDVSHYISKHTDVQPVILETVIVLLASISDEGQCPYSGSVSQPTNQADCISAVR